MLYGRGAASIAEQIGKTVEEAQGIIDKFYKSFPKVKVWIDKTIKGVHEKGYVEDVAGRRRHLPDISLPKYSFTSSLDKKELSTFNPLLECEDYKESISKATIDKYTKELSNCKSYAMQKIKAKALAENIVISDNTGFIAQAERQAVNSRVQGGAATLTKKALINIFRDSELNSMHVKLINTVHDEILVECPEEVSEAVATRMCKVMVDSARYFVHNVPMKCDPYIVSAWYLDEFVVTVQDEFKKMLASGLSDMEAFEKMCSIRIESTRDQLYEIVQGFMSKKPDDVKIIHTI